MFGVSPTYFLSRFGECFSDGDVIEAIPAIAADGFDTCQLEVFSPEQLQWCTALRYRAIADALTRSDLDTRVFVAHLVGEAFCTTDTLASGAGYAELERCLDSAVALPGVETCVIPVLPLRAMSADVSWSTVEESLVDRLRRFSSLCEQRDIRLALEIIPGAIISSAGHLYELLENAGLNRVGICLDTGHVNRCGENIAALTRRFAGRIYAVHMSDNDGCTNTSDPPGSGTVDWSLLIRLLDRSGYEGSYDLEIRCSPEEAPTAYRRGLAHVRTIQGEIHVT